MTASPRQKDEGKKESDDPQRLFVAVPIPELVRTRLRLRLAEIPLPGRPIPPENWHITLRFLGSTHRSDATALIEAMRNRRLGTPFSLTFGKLGAFPRPARASAFWIGFEEGTDALAGVAARVEEAAREVGFPPSEHPFRAHLTLSRMSPPSDVRSLLDGDVRPEEPMPVAGLVLFRSRLGRGPAVYEPIEHFPLTG